MRRTYRRVSLKIYSFIDMSLIIYVGEEINDSESVQEPFPVDPTFHVNIRPFTSISLQSGEESPTVIITVEPKGEAVPRNMELSWNS